LTQLEQARQGKITSQMAPWPCESITPELVRAGVAEGAIVIPANVNHPGARPCGIGRGLKTKVTPTSAPHPTSATQHELEKLRVWWKPAPTA